MLLLRRTLRPLFVLLTLAESVPAQWIPQVSGTDAELRGLSVISSEGVWATGVGGSVIRTLDGGRRWRTDNIPGAGALDLRAVDATSARVAHAMSIGDSSRIFRTTNGGLT